MLGVSITIVTPTLNASAYLEECLNSVHAQRIPGLEHLVVDGGSMDDTADIAQKFSDVGWLSRPGMRQAQAINEGLRHASGVVVAWLNADDLYVPGALTSVLSQFEAEPTLQVLYGDCEVIGPTGQHLWWERPGPYDFRRMLRRGNYIAQPAVFLRRRAFDSFGLLDESLHYGMDYELWLRLRGHRVLYLPEVLARFRWHPDSKSARGQLRSWSEFIRIVRRHGGGWTPEIALAFARCLITIGRTRIGYTLTGSVPIRPLTRGSA